MTEVDDALVRAAIRDAIAAGHEEAVHVAAYHKGRMVSERVGRDG